MARFSVCTENRAYSLFFDGASLLEKLLSLLYFVALLVIIVSQ